MIYNFSNYIKESYSDYSNYEMDIIDKYIKDTIIKIESNIRSIIWQNIDLDVFDNESNESYSMETAYFFDDEFEEIISRNALKKERETISRLGKGVFEVYPSLSSDRNKESYFDGLTNGELPCYHFSTRKDVYYKGEDMNYTRFGPLINSTLSESINGFTIKTFVTEHIKGSVCNIDVYVRNDNFNFINPFNKDICISYIEEEPRSLKSLGKYLNDETLIELLNDHPDYLEHADLQEKLRYIKYQKSKSNPQRRQMEEESQMYIFAARDKFKETKGGLFKKDIEIERMVPIDPYDAKDGSTLKMMKMRSTTQGDTKVYCIWLPKDAYTQEELDDINSDELLYLRRLIDEKKERI